MARKAVITLFISLAVIALISSFLVYRAIFGSPNLGSNDVADNASSSASSTLDIQEIYASSFPSPYPVVWEGTREGETELSLVGARMGYANMPASSSTSDRALTLILKVGVNKLKSGNVPLTLVRIIDESGASKLPETRAFNFGAGNNYAKANTSSTQDVAFIVPKEEMKSGYLFETGGRTNKVFIIKVDKDALVVELPPTE